MTTPFRVRRRVEFHDTDAAGIMHFASFFVLMEQAEHEFLRHLGLTVFMKGEEGTFSWPRVAVRCDYTGAVRFEDELDIDVTLSRLGSKSITYRFRMLRGEDAIATGEFTAVFCKLVAGQKPQSLVIPAEIRAKLEPYLEQQIGQQS